MSHLVTRLFSSHLPCVHCSSLIVVRKYCLVGSKNGRNSLKRFSNTNSAAGTYFLPATTSSAVFSITNRQWQSSVQTRYKSDKTSPPGDGDEDLDKPIQFSTSQASQWKAQQTHSGRSHPDVPWFQTYVVVASMAAIMIYFFILREENDMDEEIGKTLWERIPGLEKQQLQVLLKYNQERGLETTDIEKRLAEIEARDRQLLRNAASK